MELRSNVEVGDRKSRGKNKKYSSKTSEKESLNEL